METLAVTATVAIGNVIKGEVTKVIKNGIFVSIPDYNRDGLVPISMVGNGYAKDLKALVKPGDVVWTKVVKIDEEGRVTLSMRETSNPVAERLQEAHSKLNGDKAKELEFGQEILVDSKKRFLVGLGTNASAIIEERAITSHIAEQKCLGVIDSQNHIDQPEQWLDPTPVEIAALKFLGYKV